MLTITALHKRAQELPIDVVVVPLSSDLELPADFSKPVCDALRVQMKAVLFTGSWGRAELFVAPKDFGPTFIAVVGIGKKNAPAHKQYEAIRRGLAIALMDARVHVVKSIAIEIMNSDMTVPVVESLMFTNYWFSEHSSAMKADEQSRSLQKAVLCVAHKEDVQVVNTLIKKTTHIMGAVALTRHLVNQPASHMSPIVLVREAKKIAKSSSKISVNILNRAQAEKKKFFGFLAVARGSNEEPYVIHLKYTPKKALRQAQGKLKTLVLIGKGITFDSGGLSLKPAQSMENMKIDMAGAGSVLGLFSLLPTLAPDIAIHGIVLACENMPSGDAYRPGDVIATMSGKTIEVLNTDAEGRITLADALTYANALKPDAIIDLATLTGAVVVALGDTHAGLFGNSESLNEQLMESAKESGEGLVEFPLPEEYKDTVRSMVGDLRNTATTRMGGAITAALFLQEFVGKQKTGEAIPWAHLDIAGPVYAESPLIPYWQFGATGYGVRTLVKFVEEFGK